MSFLALSDPGYLITDIGDASLYGFKTETRSTTSGEW